MTHVKSVEGYDVKVPSMGQVNYNTVAGSIGLAAAATQWLGGGNGLLGNLFGGGCRPMDPGSIPVTRYDMASQMALAAKDSEISLLKSTIYDDQKSLELYRYVDGKFGAIEARLAEQAVRNQGVADAIREVSKEIDYKVNLEAERRACADGKIVSYVNGTFAPKLIADYTAGTTTTAANTYNPLCCCNPATM